MSFDRGALDVDDLLKIVLVLVIVWLAISIVEDVIGFLFGPLSSLVGVVLLAVLVLWYFDFL